MEKAIDASLPVRSVAAALAFYIYRIQGSTFHEVNGMLIGDKSKPIAFSYRSGGYHRLLPMVH